jgi:hypothetical protein
MPIKSIVLTVGLLAGAPIASFCQEPPPGHLLGLIPNFRTTGETGQYTPLSAKEKFRIAKEDSFDRGTVALGAIIAANNQLTRSQPAFGNGPAAYARYCSAGYGDLVIGNFMTEGIFPTLLHHDPRYFRRGSGTRWSRLGAAVGQIFWTRTDSGGHEFNYSEFGGNSAAVAISMAYYPASRQASDAASQLGVQIALDVAGNILKEFWPQGKRSLPVDKTGSRQLLHDTSFPGAQAH